MRVDSMLSDVHLAHPITMGLIPMLSTFVNRRLDTRYGMAYTLGMTNEPTNLDTNDHTLEGEMCDFPVVVFPEDLIEELLAEAPW